MWAKLLFPLEGFIRPAYKSPHVMIENVPLGLMASFYFAMLYSNKIAPTSTTYFCNKHND